MDFILHNNTFDFSTIRHQTKKLWTSPTTATYFEGNYDLWALGDTSFPLSCGYEFNIINNYMYSFGLAYSASLSKLRCYYGVYNAGGLTNVSLTLQIVWIDFVTS